MVDATELREQLLGLIVKWRKDALLDWDNGDNGESVGKGQCAEELDALLAQPSRNRKT